MNTHFNASAAVIMDSETKYITQTKINPHVKKLEAFLENEEFKTSKGCPYTNFVNQAKGETYYIPTTIKPVSCDSLRCEESINIDLMLMESSSSDNKKQKASSYMDELMILLEECRKSGAKLNFSEMQYSSIPEKIKKLKPPSDDVFNDTFDDITCNDDITCDIESTKNLNVLEVDNELVVRPNMLPTAEDLAGDIHIDKSGIDLDFDILQRENVRVITDVNYHSLISTISKIIGKTLDLTSCSEPQDLLEGSGTNMAIKFHAVILRKPDIVELNDPKYGHCYKESFRLRIPGIKITKEHKIYIIKQILNSGILPFVFNGIQIINPWDDVIDPASAWHPLMFLGSAKRTSPIPHEFYGLYSVKFRPAGDVILIQELRDFDPIPYSGPAIKIKDPSDGRRKITKVMPPRYKYNLCHELSVNYEAPGGLIKKREFSPRTEIETDIKTHAERTKGNLIDHHDLEEIKNNVADLSVRNSEANYLRRILDILDPNRVKTYEDWRWVIYILAWTNPDYKPLAIWFSYRFPGSWVKGGLAQLEENWNWALAHPRDDDDPDKRTVGTLYSWAKEDDPEKYEELQELNAFMKLKKLLFENAGKLNETHIAEVLYVMFGKKFVCDENPYSNAKTSERRWYEFVFPTDDIGRIKNSIYKWRREKGKPDSLDKYIAKKLPKYIEKVQEWVETQITESVTDEDQQKYYEIMKKNMKETIFSLGKDSMIKKILSRCEVEFRERGFEELLDTNTDVIGTGNGVLKVYPKTDMIQRYHEIPITRSTNVDYEPYDPQNPYIKHLETEIRRLFAHEEDAFIKTMCYLASSLDGRKKRPLFFIWLGEGQNGKSFLLELHINTLREVVKGGYGAKLNVSFFTQDRKSQGGPDSEKMMLKHARFSYCSESEPGDKLHMSKIKEFTSETLSGNEKHQTQDMFEANCHFVFGSNNDPRITGRDWGTWRRIMVYRFKMRFVPEPDPNNQFEYKEDVKFIEVVTKDPNYKKAYFSILVHYYEMYRDKYNSDLNNIKSPSIERDTRLYRNEQDTLSRFISEQIVHIGQVYPDKKEPTTGEPEKVADIPITELASSYITWYSAKIDHATQIRSEVIKWLKSSSLKKYVVNRYSGEYLVEHKILKIGEDHPSHAENIAAINNEAIQISQQKQQPVQNIKDNINPEDIEDDLELEFPGENEGKKEIVEEEQLLEIEDDLDL